MDRRDHKLALNECTNLLRKHPSHLSGRAVMSFVLTKNDDPQSALSMAVSVLNAPNSLKNGQVLKWLPRTFKSLGMPREEMAVYTGALKFYPEDEILHLQLFLAAASNRLYKEQHQAAVSLSRLTKKDKHMWWVVASLMLLAKFSKDSEQAKQLQLTLAERMAEKALKDGRLKTAEELRLYLEILAIQNKHAAMLDLLTIEGALAAKIENDPDLVSQRIDLLIQTGAFDKAIAAATESLTVRDNWIDYKHYITAVVGRLADEKDDGDHSRSESLVACSCEAFDKWAQLRGRARGAELAKVELIMRLSAAGHGEVAEKTIGSLGDQVWRYVDQFGAKAICYSDIMPYFVAYVNSFDSETARAATLERHRSRLNDRIETIRNSAHQNEDKAQSWVNLEKIRYLIQALNDDSDAGSWVADIDVMLSYGLDSTAASAKQASCSDMVLISAQRIIQASLLAFTSDSSQRSNLSAGLFKALCVLEAGIKLNDGNFLLKLYAIRLYLYLGIYERARALYDSLNIKKIQHDTLGFLINGQGMALNCFVPDLDLCYNGIVFYDSSEWNISRNLESVYENETYSNILDFIEFNDNLAHSVQRECTHRSVLRGEGYEHGSAQDVLEKWNSADVVSIQHTSETLAALHDNRDTKVMALLTPLSLTKYNLEELTRPTPIPGSHWIQLYSLTPQIIHHIVAANVESLEATARELKALTSEFDASISDQDKLIASGISQIADLYLIAADGKQSCDDKLETLVDTIKGAFSADFTIQDSAALEAICSTTVRNASVATEIYTHAITMMYAMEAQHMQSSRPVRLALSRLRKDILQRLSELRLLTTGYMRSAVNDNWVETDVQFLAPISDIISLRRKSIIEFVAKNCYNGWTRSVRNIIAQWELVH
ncbi:mitochondrial distribution and morphology [Coemansia sp. Benny D115]|nr:mitochondrial distribution and morphology [Coemansia sp. Benny D115]